MFPLVASEFFTKRGKDINCALVRANIVWPVFRQQGLLAFVCKRRLRDFHQEDTNGNDTLLDIYLPFVSSGWKIIQVSFRQQGLLAFVGKRRL